MTNPIIEEVREARSALAEEHGYDRKKILEWAREKQNQLAMDKAQKAQMAKASKQTDKFLSA